MKLIVDIPDDVLDWLLYEWVHNGVADDPIITDALNAIRCGKPIPTGHGRLIDADRLRSMYSINRANFNTVVGIQKWIDATPTVIEEDKDSEEE